MLTKYHSSIFALTMAGALSLVATPSLSSEPVTSAKNEVELPLLTGAKYVCPHELIWRTMDPTVSTGSIQTTGLDEGGLHFTPVNPEVFKKNMPASYNIFTKSANRPQLMKKYLTIDPQYNLTLNCIYEYHTGASAAAAKIKGTAGWELAIKAPTNIKYNSLTIDNKASHGVKAVVFPADETGKMTAEKSTISYMLKAGQIITAPFTLDHQTNSFVVQFQYETGKGVVNCDYKPNGGKYNTSFVEGIINTCKIQPTR